MRSSTAVRRFGLWFGTTLLLVLGYRYPWLGITLLLLIAYAYRTEITNVGDRLLALLVPFRGYSSNSAVGSYFADCPRTVLD